MTTDPQRDVPTGVPAPVKDTEVVAHRVTLVNLSAFLLAMPRTPR